MLAADRRKLFKEKREWEYMRGAGVILFHTDTLEAFDAVFPEIAQYARAQSYRGFSEFNYPGFFAEKTRTSEYRFVDLNRNQMHAAGHLCFWS